MLCFLLAMDLDFSVPGCVVSSEPGIHVACYYRFGVFVSSSCRIIMLGNYLP